jgi:hypothetical protein
MGIFAIFLWGTMKLPCSTLSLTKFASAKQIPAWKLWLGYQGSLSYDLFFMLPELLHPKICLSAREFWYISSLPMKDRYIVLENFHRQLFSQIHSLTSDDWVFCERFGESVFVFIYHPLYSKLKWLT